MAAQQTTSTKKFTTVKAWESWLAKNHDTSNSIWLMLAKKNAAKPTVTYSEALDVALCYGWIDGQKNSYDDEYWLQKFSVRKAKSIWSKKNVQHTKRLIKENKMQPAGLQAIEAAKANGSWHAAYDAQSTMIIPDGFLQALNKSKKATVFFKKLNRANLFAIAFRLQTAKKEETKQKRIAAIVAMLEKGEKFH